jgi:hypothetical protein
MSWLECSDWRDPALILILANALFLNGLDFKSGTRVEI